MIRLDPGIRYRELKDGLNCWLHFLDRKPDRPLEAGEVAGTVRALMDAAEAGPTSA